MDDHSANGHEDGQDTESSPSGGKVRSGTQYPYYGLAKVTEIAKAVQKAMRVGGDDASTDDIQRELGITAKTDRVWAYGIPAAILFGLIKRKGRGDDARIGLTSLGSRIALPGAADEERATKAAAFKTPDLYSKLLEHFAGQTVPTKEVLRNILIRDFKIVESMATYAAEAFLDSLKTAELITSAGTVAGGNGAPVIEIKKEFKPVVDADPAPESGFQWVKVPAEFIIYRCKIAKGRVIEIPLPKEITKAEVDRIHAFLVTQIDDEDFGGK